jgi:hypothetical protein
MVALINHRDADHERCRTALRTLPTDGLVTTWPCITEAMYLLGRGGGIRAQDALWRYISDGLMRLHRMAEGEWQRMRALMNDYSDAPMDVADASLVAAAETLQQRRVFTIDQHFRAYRLRSGQAFEVVP